MRRFQLKGKSDADAGRVCVFFLLQAVCRSANDRSVSLREDVNDWRADASVWRRNCKSGLRWLRLATVGDRLEAIGDQLPGRFPAEAGRHRPARSNASVRPRWMAAAVSGGRLLPASHSSRLTAKELRRGLRTSDGRSLDVGKR